MERECIRTEVLCAPQLTDTGSVASRATITLPSARARRGSATRTSSGFSSRTLNGESGIAGFRGVIAVSAVYAVPSVGDMEIERGERVVVP